MAQRSGINRGFMWLRKVLEITEETDSPRVLSEIAQPSVDVFGWQRYSPDPIPGRPDDINAQGTLAADSVLLAAVPADIMRYVIFASMSHSDPVAGGLELSMQVRVEGALDIGIGRPIQVLANPTRCGIERSILMQPGEVLLARSNPAPAVGTRLFIRYRFVDLPFGEYIPPL